MSTYLNEKVGHPAARSVLPRTLVGGSLQTDYEGSGKCESLNSKGSSSSASSEVSSSRSSVICKDLEPEPTEPATFILRDNEENYGYRPDPKDTMAFLQELDRPLFSDAGEDGIEKAARGRHLPLSLCR